MQMHTFDTHHSETRTISIAAAPDVVLKLVGDPRRLPEWAPEFAQAVEADGDDWLIDNGEAELRLTVRVAPDYGTVDLLAAVNHKIGAFTRVVHNNNGSEFLFTLFFPHDTDEAAIARQMVKVEEELQTVRALCERQQTQAA
jgi:hypothetical protein